MPDTPAAAWPETVKRWWLPTVVVLLVLLAVILTFITIASTVYDPASPDSFWSIVATDVFLNGVVVFALGTVLGLAVSFVTGMRDRRGAAAQRRLELFLRTRNAHVRAAQAQQVLRARTDIDTYHEEMRALLGVIQDLGEIREEVSVSGILYDDVDRGWIRRGLAIMIDYLQGVLAEYSAWCSDPASNSTLRPDGERLAGLIADYDGRTKSKTTPEDGDWDPAGAMPYRYDDGLEQSKLLLRAYVYGVSGKKRHAMRVQVEGNIEERRKELAKRPLGRAPQDRTGA